MYNSIWNWLFPITTKQSVLTGNAIHLFKNKQLHQRRSWDHFFMVFLNLADLALFSLYFVYLWECDMALCALLMYYFRYGTQVLKYMSYDQYSRTELPNPMCTVFPTVTSCTFHSVGTAAGEQKFNSLCVLSLNIINEKVEWFQVLLQLATFSFQVYILLWFWLFGLTILTCIHLVFRLAVIGIPPLRYLRLKVFALYSDLIFKLVV